VRAAVAKAVAGELERDGLRDWPDGLAELPQLVERTSGEHLVRGYPALVDSGDTVRIRVFATEAEQLAAMGPGVRRLLRLTLPSPVKTVERSLSSRARLILGTNPDSSLTALLEDCADAAVDDLRADSAPWTRADFTALRDRLAPALGPRTVEVAGLVEQVLAAAHEVRGALPATPPPAHVESIEDVRAQFRRLLPTGFVTRTGAGRLRDLARYVRAMRLRLDALPKGVDVDRGRMQRVQVVHQAYDELVRALPPARAAAADVRDIGWFIEELRVSLWAQQLGTARAVSEKRIFRALDAITP